jgi:hypothetical protein
MSTEEVFAIGRVVERLMISAIAGLCLTYGWNLFRVGVVNQQTAELGAKGWRINLKRVGPGVFFALFGTAVLAVSLRSPLSLSENHYQPVIHYLSASGTDGKVDSQSSQPKVVYLEGQDPRIAKRWVASLNTILHVSTPEKFHSTTEQKVISRTDEDLETLRNALVMKQFGAALFREYNEYRKKAADEGIPGSKQEPQEFAEIDEWMQGNRIEE